ncbi:MAG: methyltransferase domain-containing protein [Ferruginibacter sp.]
MIDLTNRSFNKELLDADNIPFDDIIQNMKELNTVNTLLGGHAITISGIKNFLPINSNTISICEIGCGGGDNLQAIAAYFKEQKIKTIFIGIDIKQECIHFAKRQYPSLPATWFTSDYAKVELPDKPTIIFSSLFCHHFNETELIEMLQWMKRNCSNGFFINDLHRHPLAYYSIKFITALFSRSYLVKNDGPLSVARGFKKDEWKKLLSAAGIKDYSIQWKWAFRYLIVCKNGKGENV